MGNEAQLANAAGLRTVGDRDRETDFDLGGRVRESSAAVPWRHREDERDEQPPETAAREYA